MKKSFITVVAMIIIAFVNVAQAQSLNEVLDKHFKAIGQEKLSTIQSFYVKAKVSQMGMEMPMEMKIKKPEMFIMTIEMQGQKMIQAFDGQKGWMIAPWVSPDPQELAGEQLNQAKNQVDKMNGELFEFEKKGSTAELGGKVNVDGKDAYRIKLTTKDGNTNDYFIDANTYVISKVKTKVSAQGQTVDVEQIMSDYKTIDGITMAMKIETKSPMGSGFILMEEIKFNEKFDDAIFKQPAK
jgi:outer membrane lipoprotein-sorting protein